MTTQRDISARLDRAAERARAADRVIARMDEREATLSELRCDDCAFREGTKANSQPSTVLKAQLCAEVIEPFYCHRREGLCAGWAELINKLHADGFHASQPDWQKKLKTELLPIVNAAERGEITDGIAAIRAAVESCAGGFTERGKINGNMPANLLTADKSVEYPAQQAPTEAERAVDKFWATVVEFMKLQQAANGIAAKESK